MGEHLRLPGQSHLSRVLGRLDPYGGTFEIAWSISFVPLLNWGTNDIDWATSYICPWSISYVPWSISFFPIFRGHLRLSGEIDQV